MTGYQHPILNDGYDRTVQRLQEEREAEEAAWNYAIKMAVVVLDATDEIHPMMLHDYMVEMTSHYGVESRLAKLAMSHHQSRGLVKYRFAYGIYKITGKHPEPSLNWEKDENGKVIR